MPKQTPTHSPTSSFNYLVILDLIVVAGILVVASRPDALAITISAAIIATAAGLYRGTMAVKSALKPKSTGRVGGYRPDREFKPPAPTIAAIPPAADKKIKSWLRESD